MRNSGDEQILRWSDPVLPRTLYAKAFELAGVDLLTLAARVTIVGGTVQALLSLGTAAARRIELGLTAASEPYARGMAQVVLGAAIGDGSHDIAWIVEPSGQVTCIVDGVVQDSESITFGPLFDRLVIGESCVGGSAWAGSASELYLYRLEDDFSIPGMLGSDAIVTSLPPTVSILFPLPAASEPLTVVLDTLGATDFTNTGPLNFGARTLGVALFNGSLSDIAIWDRVLTPAEVAEIYNAGAPTDNRLLSSASNLVGYWRMGNQVRFDGTMTNMEAGDIETRTF